MKFADLHAHTCFSDGSLTPQQLVELGAQKGLSALAVTDHDTVDGVERALAHGRKIGLEVIPGLEFSSQLEGRNLHLVGLFVDPRSQALQRVCQKMQQMRDQRNRQMLRQLEEAGFPVSEETFRDFQGTSLTRAHVADVLIRAGYGSNMKEVFQNYMSKGKPGYVARQVVPPEECIDAIHQAGGLAFVAHLHQISKDPDTCVRLCLDTMDLGADGLETRYSEFDDHWRNTAEEIARQRGCLSSGGSDFHSAFKPGLELMTGYGDLEVPYDFVVEMKKALRRRQEQSDPAGEMEAKSGK